MRFRNRKRKRMVYEVMDCCDLKYPDNFFDIIIDKSTIDAILCGDNAYLNTALMLKESQRVLREGGHYLAISYGKPETRSYHFTRKFLSWSLSTFTLYPVEFIHHFDNRLVSVVGIIGGSPVHDVSEFWGDR